MVNKPNILIITFDCLRPDRLSITGYKGVHTPTFDKLMKEGVFFRNAYCQAPNTWISHASLFTGCNPNKHGMRTPVRKLSTTIPTMAEIFREAGYRTMGMPAMSLLSTQNGFNRGFDDYHLEDLLGNKNILNHRFHRSSVNTLHLTRRWLRNISQPFFAWIHYFGIHKLDPAILDLPQNYRHEYSEYAQYYDGKVSYADEGFLSPLVEDLEELGLIDNTILVLCSDHGEDLSLVEHNSPQSGHNWSLTESVMRILLVIHATKYLPSGLVRFDLAQSIDVLPTLLDLAGINLPNDRVEGRSLKLHNPSVDPIIYMENLCQGFVGLRKGNYKLVLSESGKSTKIIQENLRLKGKLDWRINLVKETIRQLLPEMIRPTQPVIDPLTFWWQVKGEPEEVINRLITAADISFYDLAEDPDESHDISGSQPEILLEMMTLLKKYAKSITRIENAFETDHDRQIIEERLKKLGYL